MSAKNIRFSQTVSTKQFGKRLSQLLSEQYEQLNIFKKLSEIRDTLDKEDYELSSFHLERARQDIEALLIFLEDAQQNVSAFMQLSSEQPTEQSTETKPVEKETEVVKEQPTQDPLQQLQQIEKLVNVVKSLKGDAA